MIFVDTNIWLRAVQPSHALHKAAVDTIARLIEENETLVITPQVAAEFWNVATRPQSANGLGLSVAEARTQLTTLEGFLTVLAESQEVFAEWKRLVVEHAVQGVKTHDARIAAAMHVYEIRRIVTFNQEDFTRYGVEIVVPG